MNLLLIVCMLLLAGIDGWFTKRTSEKIESPYLRDKYVAINIFASLFILVGMAYVFFDVENIEKNISSTDIVGGVMVIILVSLTFVLGGTPNRATAHIRKKMRIKNSLALTVSFMSLQTLNLDEEYKKICTGLFILFVIMFSKIIMNENKKIYERDDDYWFSMFGLGICVFQLSYGNILSGICLFLLVGIFIEYRYKKKLLS